MQWHLRHPHTLRCELKPAFLVAEYRATGFEYL